MLHVSLVAPTGLAFTHTVLQVEHGVALLGVLFILSGRIDHGVAPLLLLVAVVEDAAHAASGNTLLGTVVVALGTLGDLDAARLAVTTEEGLRGGIDEVHAIDVHEIVMEAHGQGIGDSHPASLAVGLHVVLLVADIDNHLTGLRGLDAEIGAPFLIDLREFVARNGGLCDEGIGRYLNPLGHLDIWPLGLVAEEACHGLTIAAAQLTVARCVEVQTVRTVGAVVGGDDLCGVEGLGQFVDLLLAADADALATSLYDVSCIEVHLFGLQLQVAAEMVIDLLHHTGPLGVARVRLALVHQDTLDDTVLLSLLGQCDQTLVRVVVVGLEHAFHPVRRLGLHVVVNAVGQESLDVDAADGHMDDADLDVLRQGGHQRTAEPVGRCQSCIRTTEWGDGLVPFAHLPFRECFGGGVIHCGHPQEPWAGALQVLGFRTGGSLHVRLSETEKDVEIGIRFLGVGRQGQHT